MQKRTLSDFDYELPSELIAQAPAVRRSDSRLLHVDGRVRERPRVPRFSAPHRSTRSCGVQRHASDQGAPARAASDRRPGGASARTRALRGRSGLPASREPSAARPEASSCCPAMRTPTSSSATTDSSACGSRARARSSTISSGTAKFRCRRTSRAPPAPPMRRAIRPSTRAMPGAVAAPTAGLHFDEATLAQLAAARRGDGVRHAARRRRHVPAGRDARISPQHRMHAERYRIPAATVAAIDAARARGGRIVAVGTTSAARARIGGRRCRPRARRRGRNPPLHHARLPLPRRRPAAHELPPAALDAADAGQRVRRLRRRFAPRTRTRSRALPLLQLRRRDAARARDGCSEAGPSRCDNRRDAIHAAGRRPAARARPARRLAHGVVETPVFMPVGTYGTVKAMAPERARDARRADRARQHVPPLAAAGHRSDRRARRPAPLHGLGRARSSPTRAASRCSASARCARSRRKASRSPRRSTATGCSSRPRSRCRSSARSTRTSSWCSTSARRIPRRATKRRRRWSCRCAGRARSRSDCARRQPERAVRHRAGRHVRGPARRVARGARPRIGFDGYAIGGLSVGEPKEEMLARARPHGAAAARRPAALPDGRRARPRTSSPASRPASTCSIACCRRATRATAGCSRASATSGSATRSTAPTRARSTRPAPATPAGNFTRAYLHHLQRVNEILGARLETIHNLHYYLDARRRACARRSRRTRFARVGSQRSRQDRARVVRMTG